MSTQNNPATLVTAIEKSGNSDIILTIMRKKIIVISLIILLAGAGTAIYINTFFLPTQLRQMIIRQAQESLGRKVSVGEIEYHFIKGFILHDLVVYERNSPQEPFLKISAARFNVFFPQLIRNRKIIIPSITIDSPSLLIIREGETLWNFSDMLDKLASKNNPGERPFIFIGNISVIGGKIAYRDKTGKQEFSEALDNINAKINLSLKGSVQFLVDAVIPRSNSAIRAKGDYALLTKELSSQISLQNIPLAEYLPRFYAGKDFQINKGFIPSADVALTWEEGTITAQGELLIDDLSVKIADKVLRGNLTLSKTKLTLHDTEAELLTDLKLGKGYFKISADQEISGDLTAQDTSLAWDQQTMNIQTAFQIQNFLAGLPADQEIKGTLSATDTTLSLENKKVHLQTALQLKGADILLPEGRKFSGNPFIELQLEYDPQAKTPLQYSGSFQVEQAIYSGLPQVKQITDVKGKIQFATDTARTDSLEFKAFDTRIQMNGELNNFARPEVNVQFSAADFDLEKAALFVPELLEKNSLAPSGRTTLQGSYQGPLNASTQNVFAVTAQLKDAAVESKRLGQKVTGLFGEIKYLPNSVSWKNLRGVVLGKDYILNGEARLSAQPSISTTVQSENLNFSAQTKILKDNIQINSLSGKYFNSGFDIKGDIQLVDGQGPNLDLTGRVELEARDLAAIFPSAQKQFESIKPAGRAAGDFRLKGPAQDWRGWELSLSASAAKLSLYGYNFTNPQLQIETKDRAVNKLNLTSSVYNGELALLATADLKEQDIPFQLTGNLTNLELARLRVDTPLKDDYLSGKLSANVYLYGPINKSNAIKGQGHFEAKEGSLWRSNLFHGLWKTLLIPEYQDVVFTDAAADFQIENARVKTENLTIISQPVDLSVKGWIDFSSNLDLHVDLRFKEAALLKSSSLKKGPTAILTQANNYLTIKISGTLNQPNYSTKIGAGKVMEKTKDTLIDGIRNIFGEIF